MNKTKKQKEWSAKITDFKRSGKTKEEWCKKNNISIRQFNYWLKQETENPSSENPAAQWLPIEIKHEDFVSQFLHIKIGVATVEVNHGFDKELLSDVLKVLKAL